MCARYSPCVCINKRKIANLIAKSIKNIGNNRCNNEEDCEMECIFFFMFECINSHMITPLMREMFANEINDMFIAALAAHSFVASHITIPK